MSLRCCGRALLLSGLLLGSAHAGQATAAAERLYVSDETGGNVVVVDPQQQRVVVRIAVGKRPRGIQVSPDHRKVYVALSGSPIGGPNVDESKLPPPDHRYDGIGVVDLASQKLATTYQSGAVAFPFSRRSGTSAPWGLWVPSGLFIPRRPPTFSSCPGKLACAKH